MRSNTRQKYQIDPGTLLSELDYDHNPHTRPRRDGTGLETVRSGWYPVPQELNGRSYRDQDAGQGVAIKLLTRLCVVCDGL